MRASYSPICEAEAALRDPRTYRSEPAQNWASPNWGGKRSGTGGKTIRPRGKQGTRNKITAEIKELAHEYGPMAIKELEMMDLQKFARALAAITLAIAGVVGLLGGGALEFAIGLFLIGNALLLLGTLVWT
jgi:hypothetical protein